MLWSFSDALVVFPSLSLSLSHCLYRCVCVRMMCSTLVCFLPSLDSFCVSFSLSVLSWVTHSGSCSFSLVQSSFGASVVVVSLSLSLPISFVILLLAQGGNSFSPPSLVLPSLSFSLHSLPTFFPLFFPLVHCQFSKEIEGFLTPGASSVVVQQCNNNDVYMARRTRIFRNSDVRGRACPNGGLCLLVVSTRCRPVVVGVSKNTNILPIN